MLKSINIKIVFDDFLLAILLIINISIFNIRAVTLAFKVAPRTTIESVANTVKFKVINNFLYNKKR
jgi:hypothetical protein